MKTSVFFFTDLAKFLIGQPIFRLLVTMTYFSTFFNFLRSFTIARIYFVREKNGCQLTKMLLVEKLDYLS